MWCGSVFESYRYKHHLWLRCLDAIYRGTIRYNIGCIRYSTGWMDAMVQGLDISYIEAQNTDCDIPPLGSENYPAVTYPPLDWHTPPAIRKLPGCDNPLD